MITRLHKLKAQREDKILVQLMSLSVLKTETNHRIPPSRRVVSLDNNK